MRKLTYYIALTIDGFIADPDGGFDFYPLSEDLLQFLTEEYPETLPTHVRRALGVDEAPNRRFDTVVMGRGTYAPALDVDITSPYGHLRQYVFSRGIQQSPDPAVLIVPGDPVATVRELKAETGGAGIYLAGGADLAGQLLPEIDELITKVYPVVAGSGVPMFTRGFEIAEFALASTRAFDNGALVQTYDRLEAGGGVSEPPAP